MEKKYLILETCWPAEDAIVLASRPVVRNDIRSALEFVCNRIMDKEQEYLCDDEDEHLHFFEEYPNLEDIEGCTYRPDAENNIAHFSVGIYDIAYTTFSVYEIEC